MDTAEPLDPFTATAMLPEFEIEPTLAPFWIRTPLAVSASEVAMEP